MNRYVILGALFSVALMCNTGQAQLWQQASGIGGNKSRAVAVNSFGHIFVAAHGIHRTSDGGKSWQRIFTQAPLLSVNAIVVQPSGRILITLSRNSPIGGVYSSDDNGDSFSKLSIESDSIFQSHNGSLFALVNGWPHFSSDDGNTWIASPTIPLLTNPNIVGVYQVPGGDWFVCAGYLYRSTDKGVSWIATTELVTSISTAPDSTIYGFNALNAYNLLYRSFDNGKTWGRVNITNPWLSIRTILFNDKKQILLINSIKDELVYSSDNGMTWSILALGKARAGNSIAYAAAAEPSGKFLITLDDQLCRLDPIDIGNATPVVVPNANVSALGADANGNVVAFTIGSNLDNEFNYGGTHGWRTTNGGQPWWHLVTTDYLAPSAPHLIRHIAVDSSGSLIASDYFNLLRSTDGGLSWRIISSYFTSGIISGLALAPQSNDMFVSSRATQTVESGAVYRSIDGKNDWDEYYLAKYRPSVTALLLHPNGNLFAGTEDGIFQSIDKGSTWAKLQTVFPSPAGTVSDLICGKQGEIYAAVGNGGVYRSTNNGFTWEDRSLGLSATRIFKILMTGEGYIFAATNNGVFFLDTAAGKNWVSYNSGITASSIQALCLDNKGRLYAGTDASGVFTSSKTFKVPKQAVLDNGSSKNDLVIYPNPIDFHALFSVFVAERGLIEISVIDMLGRTVLQIGNGIYGPGKLQFPFESGGLIRGTYYVKLQTPQQAIYRTIVIQ